MDNERGRCLPKHRHSTLLTDCRGTIQQCPFGLLLIDEWSRTKDKHVLDQCDGIKVSMLLSTKIICLATKRSSLS
jgi:hypothetical protein